MKTTRTQKMALLAGVIALGSVAAIAQSVSTPDRHLVVVAGKDQSGIYDLNSGAELARFDNKDGTSDMMMTGEGVALLNHTGGNSLVALDVKNQSELARIPASALGGTRPVHSYLTPAIGGRQYYVALNDGDAKAASAGEVLNDSTLTLVDVTSGSPTRLKVVGETRLGLGHHKVGFSTKRARMVVSNISDCNDVISIYDYSNPADLKLVKSYGAADFGLDGSSPVKTCDPLGKKGVSLAPHGVGTSAATGEVYHFITATGQITIFDVDADEPSMKIIQTAGSGGSTIKDLPGGHVMVVPQRGPREIGLKADGVPCQIGQLAFIDAKSRQLISQVPVRYGEAECSTSLAGNPAGRAMPSYAQASIDGKTLFVSLGTLYGRDPGEAKFISVFDISNPARPVQQASIPVGNHNANRHAVLTGDGKFLMIPNGQDNTISVIDTAKREVVRTIATVEKPGAIVTFSDRAGPSKPVGPASSDVKS